MTPHDIMAERIRVALDLLEAGTAMMRQTLRRRHPDATDADIDVMIDAWLQDRPGAPHGDASGIARPSREPT